MTLFLRVCFLLKDVDSERTPFETYVMHIGKYERFLTQKAYIRTVIKILEKFTILNDK